MDKKIAIIGGDLRIIKLVEMFAKEDYEINVFGMERAENLNKFKNVHLMRKLEDTFENVDVVIGPIPLSSNGVDINTPFSDIKIKLEVLAKAVANKVFIAGSIRQESYELFIDNDVDVIDILNREELTVLNTISTAEGAIQIAMEETCKTLHGATVLVLGFGRVGKILSNMLKGIGANVYCEARKNVDLAWIRAYGYKPVHLNEVEEILPKADIIINTIPFMILNDERLEYVRNDALIIDLASNPGGVDKIATKNKKIKTVWALSLPGKVAPLTSAEFIKDTVENIFKELR